MKRLLVPTATSGPLTVTGPRVHHLAVVLRVQADDRLEIFDGRGTSFEAVVTKVASDSVSLELGPARHTEPPRRITIVQGLPKGDKLELVLQKGTELGASAFLPAAAKRSVVKLNEGVARKVERWSRIVEEAARQSGRSDVPEVLTPVPLSDVEVPGATVLVLDEEERERTLSMAVNAIPLTQPVALVIGPEGGLDRVELEALVNRGALTVTLGGLVLRTETAALAALSIVRHLDGLLG
jgi:16S rRNA (uracil1498-N3)-methyltransferase